MIRSIAVVTTAAAAVLATTVTGSAGVPVASTGVTAAPSGAGACATVLDAPTRSQALAAAARTHDVPVRLLGAVSYMLTRWEDHGGQPSADAGFGPMHLVDLAAAGADEAADGRGEARGRSPQAIDVAAGLTGLSAARLRSDPDANVCGGAALLAAYHDETGGSGLRSWAPAVVRYGAAANAGGESFARQVWQTMRSGAAHRTAEGDRVALPAAPSLAVPASVRAEGPSAVSDPETDCPASLGCEWVPAPYEKLDPSDPDGTTSYGNHDLSDRTGGNGPAINYIVIHDTEGSYDGTLDLVQDPAYVSWNYTLRSSDGHIAQHVDPKDVAFHAGNWYMNMHSIGLEHEGKGGSGAWFTEAMYQTSARLVRHLTAEYDIPRDRAHVVGHDQVPGILPGSTKSVHWDPGPYWDWEHYMRLIKAPVSGTARVSSVEALRAGDVVTVRPGFDDNVNPITQCEEQSPGSGPCLPGAGTNFAPLYSAPSTDAPLASDVGWHPDGSASTTSASDVGARAAAGTELVVSRVSGDWVQVSWNGEPAWVQNPDGHRVLVRTSAPTVTLADGLETGRVYGRAYPEASAYPEGVPPEAITPIEYTLKPGQAYVVGDLTPDTDYYRSKTFDGSAPGDRTDIVGTKRYYQVWTGHRIGFVPVEDVVLSDAAPVLPRGLSRPVVRGALVEGRTLRAGHGRWDHAGAGFTYRWIRDGLPLARATGRTYTLTRNDVGARISVRVTASSRGGEAVATSERTGRIARG